MFDYPGVASPPVSQSNGVILAGTSGLRPCAAVSHESRSSDGPRKLAPNPINRLIDPQPVRRTPTLDEIGQEFTLGSDQAGRSLARMSLQQLPCVVDNCTFAEQVIPYPPSPLRNAPMNDIGALLQ